MLIDKLNKNNVDYILIREPGGAALSESIRNLLLSNKSTSINPETESLLFLAARSNLIDEKIIPQIGKKLIICDRFIDSTIVYQGYGRGLDIDLLEKLNCFAVKNIVPSLTFLLDINMSEYNIRMKDKIVDRMESAGQEFMDKVRGGYLDISKKFSSRVCILDGAENRDLISNKIWDILINKGVIKI